MVAVPIRRGADGTAQRIPRGHSQPHARARLSRVGRAARGTALHGSARNATGRCECSAVRASVRCAHRSASAPAEVCVGGAERRWAAAALLTCRSARQARAGSTSIGAAAAPTTRYGTHALHFAAAASAVPPLAFPFCGLAPPAGAASGSESSARSWLHSLASRRMSSARARSNEYLPSADAVGRPVPCLVPGLCHGRFPACAMGGSGPVPWVVPGRRGRVDRLRAAHSRTHAASHAGAARLSAMAGRAFARTGLSSLPRRSAAPAHAMRLGL